MAKDYADIAFTSAYRYERVELKGNTALTGTFSSPTTATITHNLGYKPYFKMFYRYDSGRIIPMFAGAGSYDLGGNQIQVNSVNQDDNNIFVTFQSLDFSSPPTVTATIYYRIYAEPQ